MKSFLAVGGGDAGQGLGPAMQRVALRAAPELRRGRRGPRLPIRVVLADDHEFVRRNLRMLLDSSSEVEVVAEARDIDAVMTHVRADHPRVLVLDLNMPSGATLSSVRSLRRDSPDTAIVVTTMIDDPRLMLEAVAAGASGYVLKDNADRDLVEAIRRAARGASFVAVPIAPALTTYDRQRDPLNVRELDVLRLIARGHSNPETARLLGISSRAVETYGAHLQRKLGLATRDELVRYALRRGLVAAAEGTA
jgi:two-component system response regulator NreC